MKAPEKFREPDELVSDFYSAFSESYREAYKVEFGETLTEAELQRLTLSHIRRLFRRRRPPWEVDELFAKFGPRGKRKDSHFRRGVLVRHYGGLGKPPKLKFARMLAKQNAEMIKKGFPKSVLWGSGATHVPTMHDYIKETFKLKENRDIADNVCRYYQNRGKFPPKLSGGNKV
jgi:hypothetical protein